MLGGAVAKEVKVRLEETGSAEIEFYQAKGVLDGFRKINGIS